MPEKSKQRVIPYAPRAAFLPFHNRKERWACLVAHRRAGKTVAAINDIVKRALEKPPAPYHYFAPYRSQAKSVAWDYLKFYTRPIWGKEPNEAELRVTLVGDRPISLFGADNADAARGQGSGGVYCDEFGDFRPSVWGNVIRPMLAERQGWAVFGGTPKGHNQFYDIYRLAKSSADWFVMTLKASESKILPESELRAAREQLSEDQYLQEFECSFDAAILGAFYGKEMLAVDAANRITKVDYDPEFLVHTAWDIGYTDDTAIWFYQHIGGEIHLIDHFAESGGTIEEAGGHPGSLMREIMNRVYKYGTHWLPHDARAKTLAAGGKSVVEKMARFLGHSSLKIAPNLSVEDGIQAVRTLLGRCWFDHRCNKTSTDGVEALRQYQREYDEDKKVFRKIPLHNWASHSADAFRMLAVSERAPAKLSKPQAMDVFRSSMMPTLDELWAAQESKHEQWARI